MAHVQGVHRFAGVTPRHAYAFAVAAALAIALVTVLGAAALPNYSHAAQFISELGASGAAHENAVRFARFLPAGVLLCLFVVAAYKGLPRSRATSLGLAGIAVYAAGYLVASVFPCDAGCRPAQPSTSQIIHNVVGLAGYLLAPAFLSSLAWSARRWPGGAHLAALGVVAALLALGGLMTLSPKSPYAGLSQRMVEASVLLWVVLCGAHVRSRNAAQP
jgi:hypothetical protein